MKYETEESADITIIDRKDLQEIANRAVDVGTMEESELPYNEFQIAITIKALNGFLKERNNPATFKLSLDDA